MHAQNLYASAVKEMEACTKDPHLFFPGMKDVCDNATVRLPVLPPPSILDREAFSAAVAAAAAILMQGVRDCDAEGACRMGREGGEWPWRYGGNWIQDCRFVFWELESSTSLSLTQSLQSWCRCLLGCFWAGRCFTFISILSSHKLKK